MLFLRKILLLHYQLLWAKLYYSISSHFSREFTCWCRYFLPRIVLSFLNFLSLFLELMWNKMAKVTMDEICHCGRTATKKTSWTNQNPSRRYSAREIFQISKFLIFFSYSWFSEIKKLIGEFITCILFNFVIFNGYYWDFRLFHLKTNNMHWIP